MSTTFGVKIPSTNEIKPIARRIGKGNGKVEIWFTDLTAELLPNDLEVEAMDNSSQGIDTIGDLKLAILKNQTEPKYNKSDLKRYVEFLKGEGIVIEDEHKPQDFEFLYGVWSGKNPNGLL